MKTFNLDNVLIAAAGIVAVVAFYFTYLGFSDDFSENLVVNNHIACMTINEDCNAQLDTDRILEEPCYELNLYEKSSSGNGESDKDSYSKTIVKITNDGNPYEFEKGDIKAFQANSSINIMLETYTVSKLSDSCDQYLVTVESFSTKVEKLELELPSIKPRA